MILLAVFLELVGQSFTQFWAKALQLLQLGRVLKNQRACFERFISISIRGESFRVAFSCCVQPLLDPSEELRIGAFFHYVEAAGWRELISVHGGEKGRQR